MRFLGTVVLAWLVAASAGAQIRLGPTDDVEARLNVLSPGDEVILEDGLYVLSERFYVNVVGTADQPIVIRAADGARPHFRQDAGQNIWDLDARHTVLRGLEFSGGSAGLRVQSAEDLTIEDCEIHDTGDVALRMNDSGQTYLRIQILRNHFHDTGGTGEGMYLGCNDDACRMADSVIRGNYVHHTDAGDVSQGDGIELKEGSYGCVIADNVVHDTNYPCILGYATLGNGAPNLVERNVVWACGGHGIQWAADAIIRNNVVLSGSGNGAMAFQPHAAGVPGDLVIVHNTVVAPEADAIALRGVGGPVLVANNAVYAQAGRAIFVRDPHPMLTIVGNVGEGGIEGFAGGLTDSTMGADLRGASYSGGLPNDVFPRAGSALIASGDGAHVPLDDFNGTTRGGVADVGAYAYGDGENPGWTFATEPKPETGEPPMPLDGGVPPGDDAGVAPPSDAAVPTTDAGAAFDAGAAADAGTAGGSDGCSCRATSSGGPSGALLLALLAFFALRPRRSRCKPDCARSASPRRAPDR